jgi:hypothetical protein
MRIRTNHFILGILVSLLSIENSFSCERIRGALQDFIPPTTVLLEDSYVHAPLVFEYLPPRRATDQRRVLEEVAMPVIEALNQHVVPKLIAAQGPDFLIYPLVMMMTDSGYIPFEVARDEIAVHSKIQVSRSAPFEVIIGFPAPIIHVVALDVVIEAFLESHPELKFIRHATGSPTLADLDLMTKFERFSPTDVEGFRAYEKIIRLALHSRNVIIISQLFVSLIKKFPDLTLQDIEVYLRSIGSPIHLFANPIENNGGYISTLPNGRKNLPFSLYMTTRDEAEVQDMLNMLGVTKDENHQKLINCGFASVNSGSN